MMNKIQIEQELVRIIQSITGIPNANIRIAYQTAGMPFIEDNQDYCFISLNFFDNVYTSPIEIKFDGVNEIEEYKGLRGIIANLTFIGSNAFENATKTKVMTKDSFKMKNLRKDGIYLICNTSEPRRMPALINQQWYDQAYLDLRFYQKIVYNTDRHYIDSVEINLISDHEERTFTIEGGNE